MIPPLAPAINFQTRQFVCFLNKRYKRASLLRQPCPIRPPHDPVCEGWRNAPAGIRTAEICVGVAQRLSEGVTRKRSKPASARRHIIRVTEPALPDFAADSARAANPRLATRRWSLVCPPTRCACSRRSSAPWSRTGYQAARPFTGNEGLGFIANALPPIARRPWPSAGRTAVQAPGRPFANRPSMHLARGEVRAVLGASIAISALSIADMSPSTAPAPLLAS